MKQVLFVLFLLLVVLGAAIGYFQYNKQAPDLADASPAYTLTSDALFDAFDENEEAAMAMYGGQVVEISGVIAEISRTEEGQSIVIAAENALAGGVNCAFSQDLSNIEKGESVTVKCLCQGFLMDVVLNQCKLVAHE